MDKHIHSSFKNNLVLSNNTAKSFTACLIPIHSPLSLCSCLGLPQPRCKTLHLSLLTSGGSHRPLFSLLRSLTEASLPYSMLTVSLSLVSTADLMRVNLSPLSMTSVRMLNDNLSQYQLSKDISLFWSPAGHWAVYHNYLNVTIHSLSTNRFIQLIHISLF